MTQITRNKIFNPQWNDDLSKRTIIKWNTTGLFQLNSTKYSWAKALYPIMVWNFWIPEKISGLWNDANQFEQLSEWEKRAYKWIISFLIFLDSIQTVNLPNFNDYITSPDVNLILSIQSFQEAIHSQSYQTLLEAVIDKKDRDEIYYFWRTDKHLLERNEFIWDIYQKFIDNPNDENFFRWIIWNFLLESIYFYNGFAFFDTLADQWKMVATDRMISYIRKDELCVHPDTELLTEKGWMSIEVVNKLKNVKIAQIDLNNEEMSFDYPLHYTWRDYNWKMIKIVNKTWKWRRNKVFQNIIPEHDIVLKSSKSWIIKKFKAENANFHPYVYFQQWWKVEWKNKLTNFERLLIAIQADGSVDEKRKWEHTWFHTLHIWLTKKRKKDRIESILKELEQYWIYYTKTCWKKENNEKCKYYIKVPNDKFKSFKSFKDWVDISKMNTETAKEFIKEVVNWDWRNYEWQEAIKYFNKNKEDIDIIQQIAVIANIKHSIIDKKPKKGYTKKWYIITFWMNHVKYHVSAQNFKKEYYDYDWKIWCVTMPKWTIITRYNWNVSVTWNCHVSIFANILNEIKKEFPEIYNEKTIIEMMEIAVKQEIKWSKHIINECVIWMSNQNIEEYTKWLANQRLQMLWIKPLYPEIISNPYQHLDRMQDNNWEKTNFFESSVTNYSQSSSMKSTWEWDGWDDL